MASNKNRTQVEEKTKPFKFTNDAKRQDVTSDQFQSQKQQKVNKILSTKNK